MPDPPQDSPRPPPRRGRPRVSPPGSAVTTWVSTDFHDKLVVLARKHDRSVSAVVRDLLSLHLTAARSRE